MDSVKTLSACLIALTLIVALFQISQVTASPDHEFWAVLIAGYLIDDPDDRHYHEDIRDTYYLYHVLNEHLGYDHDNILYLSVDTIPQISDVIDGTATKKSVRDAITDWLWLQSGPSDTVLIYFCGHGGGLYTGVDPPILPDYYELGNGIEYNGDEGEEVRETTINMDVNGDDVISSDTWAGIDEHLLIWNTVMEEWDHYWDDEIAEDLDQAEYEDLVFLVSACKSGNETCFSGGLIDDLSSPNRVIISTSNETNYSYGDYDQEGQPGYGFSEFSEGFIDALHGEKAYWDYEEDRLKHPYPEPVLVDADENNNGYVSVLEAFEYARDNDPYAEGGLETPWLDDDGDGLPTYVYEQDVGDYIDDGVFASHVYLDVDAEVSLSVKTYLTNGTAIYGVKVWIDGAYVGDSWVTEEVLCGNHSVKLESPIYRDGHKYYFRWEDGQRYNPRTFYIVSDTTLRAYYNAVPDAPQISGPTSGFPDTSYAYNISTTDPEGDDVRYLIDWGDDSEDTTTEYYQSGTTVSVSHSWEYSGTYNILLYANDNVNPFLWSDPSYLEVSITGVNLVVEVPQAEPNGVTVRVDEDYYTSPVDIWVRAGIHVIEVPESFLNDAGTKTYYVFTFSRWQDGSTANPRQILLAEDTTFTAYYMRSKYGILSQE